MAKSNTTSLHAAETESDLDRADRVHANLRAVQAIIDAACVLSALERTEERTDQIGMTTGGGWAGGHTICDDTLPDMLHHARRLAESVEHDFEIMRSKPGPVHAKAAA